MAKAGSCFFRIGYFLYSRTRIGYMYHQRDIKKAQEKLGDNSHSEITEYNYGNLSILPIPMLLDNYAYLVSDRKNGKHILIDPGHAEAVQKVLTHKSIQPDAILITHKHWDHSGGNKELKQLYPGLPVYGGSSDSVPDVTRCVQDGEALTFGDLNFQVTLTPGHTVGHVIYLLSGKPFGIADCLFSGDHLFLSGCGRMFEGSARVMLQSLDKILKLPEDALLWPGHEYAKENLEFACHIDADNDFVQRKLEWVIGRRERNLVTCPSTLSEERSYNPFLRTSEKAILDRLGIVDSGDVVTPTDDIRARALDLLREEKDRYNYKL